MQTSRMEEYTIWTHFMRVEIFVTSVKLTSELKSFKL